MAGGFALATFIVIVVAVVFLGSRLWHSAFGTTRASDYTGEGVRDIVVEVHSGDSTTAIGEMLNEQQVVADLPTFVAAAERNSAIAAIQPGFYTMRTEIPAADAVTMLADPANRVGMLVIPEGRQLDDVADVRTGVVTEGILTLISRASCVTLDGQEQCVSVDALKQAAATETPAALVVPDWAVQPVEAMGDDHRRLEGLIAAGSWNVNPSAPASQILSNLLTLSASQYAAGGLITTAEAMNMSPYEILTVASLVQRESTPMDFPKVARVIYNRLAVNQMLEFDSTVNYALDLQEVATTDADRARATPWNTYASPGLPATPICSPSVDALAAAENPAAGDWLYFVTIDLQGTTRFTRDFAEHERNIQLAIDNGVLDSAR
ncbi:MAG: endolytic transglycosylase MltG [Mycobacterium sp.]